MSENKWGGIWAVVVGLLIGSFIIWDGMYRFASGYIGKFWE